MLIFANPLWLAIGAAAAAAGAWALWRGQSQVRAVSSLRLWRDLDGPSETRRRRLIDPLWLLVWLAAILAAFAAASPRWLPRSAASPPPLPIDWSVRTLACVGSSQAPAAEAWLHLPRSLNPYGPLTLIANAHRVEIKPETLDRGVAIPLPAAPGQVDLTVEADGQPVAHQVFIPPPPGSSAAPFALLVQTSADRTIDPALLRVFSLQPGARLGDPSIRPAVLLVDDPHFAGTIPAASLVIASPQTPLPGLEPGPLIESPPDGWTPQPAAGEAEAALAWPVFSPLNQVRVRAMRDATLGPEWHILATAGGHPWVAARWWPTSANTPDRALLLWLSSSPSAQTNWPVNPSFVTFFAEMAKRQFSRVSLPGDSQTRISAWIPSLKQPADSRKLPPQNDLSAYFAGVAIACAIAASAWFLQREHWRPTSPSQS